MRIPDREVRAMARSYAVPAFFSVSYERPHASFEKHEIFAHGYFGDNDCDWTITRRYPLKDVHTLYVVPYHGQLYVYEFSPYEDKDRNTPIYAYATRFASTLGTVIHFAGDHAIVLSDRPMPGYDEYGMFEGLESDDMEGTITCEVLPTNVLKRRGFEQPLHIPSAMQKRAVD